MTRKEEIKEMAKTIASHITSDKDMQVAFTDALRRGAKWADEHPHWRSVEEELPPKYDSYLTHSSSNVIEITHYNIDGWHTESKGKVTHWMPLPQLPTVAKNATVKVIDFLERLEKETEMLEEETRYCRTCKHRKRFSLNEYSNKVVQCCDLQPSNRSNSGYKTIKVTDVACGFYKEASNETKKILSTRVATGKP